MTTTDGNAKLRQLTPSSGFPTMVAMEVHLPQSQEVQLNELAAKTGRGTNDLVQEAVAQLLAHNEWFKEQVWVGIDQIARGEVIEEAEMDARFEHIFRLIHASRDWPPSSS